MIYVYLAGPIAGCTNSEANDWREDFQKEFEGYNITGVSPLRCEPIPGRKYKAGAAYKDHKLSDDAAFIAGKNMLDVKRCDVTLAHMPKALMKDRPSIGTTLELGWSMVLEKPIILVTDDLHLQHHPDISRFVPWIYDNMADATETIRQLYGVYA